MGGTSVNALVERGDFWPHMRNDVEHYVRTCLVCQQDKVEQSRPSGLLEPLPVPERPWECISMDFIIKLPTVDGFGNIMVVVNRFSKYGIFAPLPPHWNAEDTAKVFFEHVVKNWGIPQSIISDRDARFTGRFWTVKIMGTLLLYKLSPPN